MDEIKRPKIGLALGSGGARGFAHIGVIKVLEENNIPIDYIAGSSIGAVVGGLYAAKKNIQEVEEMVQDTDWKQFVSLLDPCLRLGLLHGEKARLFIEKYIDKIHFKDLKIPFSAVATNYHTGKAVVIQRGEVSAAIRASMSVPMAFKPARIENKVLVDGALAQPVPVRIVKHMGADIVIAVNLDGDYFSYPAPSKIGYVNVALRTIDTIRFHLAEEHVKEADIVVNPRVGHITWFSFVAGKNALKAGEEAMRPKIGELKNIIEEREQVAA